MEQEKIYWGDGRKRSVVPTCLWQSDSMHVVTDSELQQGCAQTGKDF